MLRVSQLAREQRIAHYASLVDAGLPIDYKYYRPDEITLHERPADRSTVLLELARERGERAFREQKVIPGVDPLPLDWFIGTIRDHLADIEHERLNISDWRDSIEC